MVAHPCDAVSILISRAPRDLEPALKAASPQLLPSFPPLLPSLPAAPPAVINGSFPSFFMFSSSLPHLSHFFSFLPLAHVYFFPFFPIPHPFSHHISSSSHLLFFLLLSSCISPSVFSSPQPLLFLYTPFLLFALSALPMAPSEWDPSTLQPHRLLSGC